MIKTPQNGIARLSLLACAVAFSGSAMAGVVSAGTAAFDAADLDNNDSLSKTEFASTLEEGTSAKVAGKQFKKADVSKNGGVSLLEYLGYIEEQEAPTKEEASFDDADLNNSNGIDLEEFVATAPGKGPIAGLIKTFLIADADANDALSPEEWTLLKKGKAKPEKGEKFLKFDLVDLNEDDELTAFEFSLLFPRGTSEAKVMAKFVKLDKDEDEVLTRSEYNPGGPKGAQ